MRFEYEAIDKVRYTYVLSKFLNDERRLYPRSSIMQPLDRVINVFSVSINEDLYRSFTPGFRDAFRS